ncbi:ASCH domain-containing protein, partial [Kocuria salina]|uniref:ASCH domain-containing protein n=1 Tax=Kocuria salina TaxID=1929416 RepID=UPI0020D0A110
MDESMPVAEFATPGPLRDRLVQLIRSGAKTGTSSLLGDYEAEDQPLPRPGECQTLIDSTGRVVATLEITEVA